MNDSDLKSFLLQTLVLTIWLGLFGTQIELEPLIDKFKTPKGILLGAVLQTIFLPAWTSVLIAIFGSSGYVAIAYLIVACSPGGTNSNIWCLVTQSDLALSAAMTTFSTFLCAGMMPLNLFLYGSFLDDKSDNDIPMVQVLVPAVSIIVGTGVGIYLRYKMDYTERTLRRLARAATLMGVIIYIFATVKIYTDEKPTVDFSVGDYFMAILMNGTTLVAGALIGKCLGLTKPEAVSVGYEVSTQNLSIPLFIFYNSYSEEVTANMTTVIFLFGITSLLLNIVYMVVMVKLGWTNRNLKGDDESARPSWQSTKQMTSLPQELKDEDGDHRNVEL